MQVPRVGWDELVAYFVRHHRLGEHVAIEGPTGSGKTVAALCLLEERGKRQTVQRRPVSITVLAVKPRDRTLSLLAHWRRMRDLKDWPPPYGDEQVILWPTYGDPATATQRQRAVFEPALKEIMASGSQIVYIDEAAYFEEPQPTGLGLHGLLNQFWYMSRGNGVTLMAATSARGWCPARCGRSRIGC